MTQSPTTTTRPHYPPPPHSPIHPRGAPWLARVPCVGTCGVGEIFYGQRSRSRRSLGAAKQEASEPAAAAAAKDISGSPLWNTMSLIIRNLQQTIPIRRVPLRKKIEQLRCILGVQKFDLGVICASSRHMQWLNKTYKGKNIPTDVLSFPFHENLKAGELPYPCTPDEYNLGDIFLGVEYIHQQCEEYKEDYNNVLIVTVAHGMCHLLGYKHSTEADWLQMYEKELQVLQALNKLSGTNLQPLTKNHF